MTEDMEVALELARDAGYWSLDVDFGPDISMSMTGA
jgi:hypothetical protein